MATTRAATRSNRGVVRRYLTPQHGVWPMLLVPYVLGVACAGPSWWQLPLLVAWVSGYLLSYHLLIAVKTRRPSRVRPQLVLHTALTVVPGVAVLVAFPSLLWFVPVFAVLLAVNAWYAWRRRDRAVVNDLASVLMCVLVAPMAAVVAGEPASAVTRPTVLVLLYFAGTVPYVKTMIRERGDRRYYLASVAYHGVALVVAALVSLAAVPLFGWLLLRATVLPRLGLVPKQVGTIEILNCVLLVLTAAAWVA